MNCLSFDVFTRALLLPGLTNSNGECGLAGVCPKSAWLSNQESHVNQLRLAERVTQATSVPRTAPDEILRYIQRICDALMYLTTD